MLATKTRVIEQLIQLARFVRDIQTDAGRRKSVVMPVTLTELIRCGGDPEIFDELYGDQDRGIEDAVDVMCDPNVMELWGWMSGYAELAGYDVDLDGHHRGDVEALLKDLGILGGPGDMLEKIGTGEIDVAPSDTGEPAPIKVYAAIKESLQLTTRTRLAVTGEAIEIRNDNHDVLDEYARQASVAIVGLLNL